MTGDKRAPARPVVSDHDSYLERCLRVLEAVAPQPAPSTLARISELSGLPLSTVHRLVRVLEDSGAVQRVGRRYRIGGRLVAITAHSTLERCDQTR
ncbi:helix-turn-helix domain-containing protein [Saccharothrix longispora]|uniref:helix-turn-helix domain-containing protein n=1 Tax=Saccharothrix longispora TaxID=33920 RepID=UPI0028FD8259|nr:helix-turn-helix domain-containing protein [Saccharothrix longispora]MDU0293323.1 helix-turn-helix domain-containing protein [Saccharothrix longispora]